MAHAGVAMAVRARRSGARARTRAQPLGLDATRFACLECPAAPSSAPPLRRPGILPAFRWKAHMSQRLTPRSEAAPGTGPAVTDGSLNRISFEEVRSDPRVKIYVRKADEALSEIGYTEHGERHVGLVAHIAYNTLKRLGYPEREAELAAIAGYLHDIGNAVNRDHHAQTGGAMAMQLLSDMGMPDLELVQVI